MKGPRIDNDVLLSAGMELMRQNGKPMAKLPSKGRSMLYKLPSGETVRVRTCNDHILIVVGDSPEAGAKLNIEGTDWLFVIMPEIERTPGSVIAYLLPTDEVVAEARRTHQEWLDSNPNTKGDNRTWNLWFRGDGKKVASGYAQTWAGYQLEGDASTEGTSQTAPVGQPGGIKEEVEVARSRIAGVAGVPVEAVKITIDFGV